MKGSGWFRIQVPVATIYCPQILCIACQATPFLQLCLLNPARWVVLSVLSLTCILWHAMCPQVSTTGDSINAARCSGSPLDSIHAASCSVSHALPLAGTWCSAVPYLTIRLHHHQVLRVSPLHGNNGSLVPDKR